MFAYNYRAQGFYLKCLAFFKKESLYLLSVFNNGYISSRSERTEGQTNVLLVLVFSWDLQTITYILQYHYPCPLKTAYLQRWRHDVQMEALQKWDIFKQSVLQKPDFVLLIFLLSLVFLSIPLSLTST